VYELVSGIYESSASGASRNVREVVEAVEEMRKEWPSDQRLTQAAIILHTKGGSKGVSKLGAMTVQRAVRHALHEGWLINNAMTPRNNKVYDLAVGEALPAEQVLPTPQKLADEWVSNTVTAVTGGPVSTSPIPRGTSVLIDQQAAVALGDAKPERETIRVRL
jgi:hypothetical protein